MDRIVVRLDLTPTEASALFVALTGSDHAAHNGGNYPRVASAIERIERKLIAAQREAVSDTEQDRVRDWLLSATCE